MGTLDCRFIGNAREVAEVTELIGIIQCHLGYHVWPGEPWDHCIRCFIRYPEQVLDHHDDLSTYDNLCKGVAAYIQSSGMEIVANWEVHR